MKKFLNIEILEDHTNCEDEDCAECCEHDDHEDGHCLNCGKDVSEDLRNAAEWHADSLRD